MPEAPNNNSHNNSANTGFSAAEQRVMDRDRMARRYTDMSNGVYRNSSPSPPQLSAPPPPAPSREAPTTAERSTGQTDTAPQRHSLIPGLLENADPEKLLLAALMLLLVSEGADFVLIAALIYVMM